jgi:hypothetical protein
MTDADRLIDRLLAEDGARWRAAEPPAPDPVLQVRPRRPRRPRWQPIAVALAVIALTAGIVAVAAVRRPAGPPPAVGPTGVPTDAPTEAVVHDGDTVRGGGEVVALPGQPARLCGRRIVNLLPGEDEQLPPCEVWVTLLGADLDLLTGRHERGGAVWGYGWFTGTYRDRTLTVTRQEPPPEPQASPPPHGDLPADCPAPPGGWRGDVQADPDINRVARWLAASSRVTASLRIARPTANQTPTVLLVGTTGDVEATRRQLRELFSGSLCVVRVRHSDAEVRAAMAAIRQAMQDPKLRARYGISLPGGEQVSDAGEPTATYSVMVYDEAAHELALSIGTDLLLVEAQLRKVR